MRTFAQQAAHYNPPGQPVALSGLARQVGLAGRGVVSLAAVLAGPEVRRYDMPQQLHAGDVVADEMHVQLQSDGGFRFRGSVFDHGTVMGDDFAVSAVLTGVPGFVPAMTFSGNVGHQTHNRWDQAGFHDGVRDHWDALAAAGVSWNLQKKALVSNDDWLDLFNGVMKIVAFGGLVLLAQSVGGSVSLKTPGGQDLLRKDFPGRNTDPADP